MNQIDDIADVALLGTASRKIRAVDFPEELRMDVSSILDSCDDYEDGFLRCASMAFAFQNSGMSPTVLSPDSVLKPCQPENLPYMHDMFVSLLKYLYDNGFHHLFRFALSVLRDRRVVFPEYALPYFVNLAYTSQSKYLHQYRLAIWPLLGARGKWLVDSLGLAGEKFAESSHSLRLRMFVAMRKAGVRGTSALLGSIWPDIGEKQRKDFLSVFMRVTDDDLSFLESVFSGPDSDAHHCLPLLCRNSNSTAVRLFMDVLDEALTIDGRRHCDFAEVKRRDELARYGIDSAVDPKGNLPSFLSKLPENEILIFKLIHSVPLAFWMGKLGCDVSSATKFLFTNPAFRIGFDFKGVILRFQDSDWATEYCLYKSTFEADFLPFLSAAQLDRIAGYCDFDNGFRINEKICGNIDSFEPWGDVFAKAVLDHIIRTRNIDNTLPTAQLLAAKLPKSVDYFMQNYVSENYGNDIVVSFFAKVIKLRKTIRSLIS